MAERLVVGGHHDGAKVSVDPRFHSIRLAERAPFNLYDLMAPPPPVSFVSHEYR